MNRLTQIFVFDLLKIVLSATVFLMPIAGFAQDPAQTPSPAANSQATSEGQRIPLAEISSRAEYLKKPLREIARRLSTGAEEVAQVEEAEEQITAQSRQLDERLAAKPTLYELRKLDQDWKDRSEEGERWQKILTQRLTSTETDLRWLKEEQAKWVATLEQLTDGDSLEAVFDQIKASLADLQGLQAQTQERLNSLLLLQNRITQLNFLAATRLDDLALARQNFQRTLLVRASPTLWAAIFARNDGSANQGVTSDLADRSFVHEMAAARESIQKQRNRFFFLLLLFVVLLSVTIYLSKRIDPLTEGKPELHEAATILRRPISAALLIILLVQLWLSPVSASVVNSIVALFLVIPFLQVVRSLFEPIRWMRLPFFVLVVLHLSDQVRYLVDFKPLVERLLFLAETAVAIAVLIWMLRPQRFDRLPVQPLTLRWLRVALRLMLGLIAISLVANVFGFVTLAKVLGEGALHSAYLAGLMYGAAKVVNVGIALLLRIKRTQVSVFVRLHRRGIVKWCSRICYFLAGFLWLIGSLELFTIREQFFAGIERLLDASLSFRSLSVSIGDVASFLVVVTLAYYLSKVVRLVLQEDVLSRMPLERGVPQALATTAQYVLLFAGFVMAVSAAGFDLNRLTLLTGAFGVGIGFGLQNIINNFVSGLILLFERPVQIGDAVQVGNVSGDITSIGIRSSRIRTAQGAEVIVPNAKLISDEVTNWTLPNRNRRVDVSLGVAYGSDPAKVIEVMLATAKANSDVLAEPEPQVFFTSFGDNALQFELRFWAANQGHLAVKSQVALAVSEALEKAGIEIPSPQKEMRLRLDDETVSRIIGGPKQ